MVSASPSLDIAGRESTVTDTYAAFAAFFGAQSGSWNSTRTYHYTDPTRQMGHEDSATTFEVSRLGSSEVAAVLAVNGDAGVFDVDTRAKAQGFRVSFLTRMSSQAELVENSTDLAFVPISIEGDVVRGNYYRMKGYEEKAPVKAAFVFTCATQQLRMITNYTSVVSCDEIHLVNPTCRLVSVAKSLCSLLIVRSVEPTRF
jgi:CpeS-like protein